MKIAEQRRQLKISDRRMLSTTFSPLLTGTGEKKRYAGKLRAGGRGAVSFLLRKFCANSSKQGKCR